MSSSSIPLVSSVAVRLPDRTRVLALALGVLAFGLYLFVGSQGSGTDEFIPLAGALLRGEFAVDARPWVELVPVGSLWYVPFPPVPALFYMPVVAIMGVRPWNEELAMGVMPAIVGALSVGVAFLLLRKRGVAERPAIWITAGFATTTLLWVAGTGGTHHMAQASATLFLLGTLWFALDRRRPYLAGFLFSLAVGSRLPVGAAIPLFFYLYRRDTWKFLVGAVPVAALIGLYNLARFGSITDFGYARIPSSSSTNGLVTGEPWFKDGIESPTYIPQGLQAMLWSWPTIDPSQAPFIRPSLQADSLLLAAPFLALVVPCPRTRRPRHRHRRDPRHHRGPDARERRLRPVRVPVHPRCHAAPARADRAGDPEPGAAPLQDRGHRRGGRDRLCAVGPRRRLHCLAGAGTAPPSVRTR